uniref:Uncharacterized protein n=1 Tax=Pseudomonas phage HRDY3 TaxID=3236930 RepID=A0AB39CDS4_9VIRU
MDQLTDREIMMAKTLHEILKIHIGVYPLACNDVPRTERQTGWNEARKEYARRINKIVADADPSISIAIEIIDSLDPLPFDQVQVKVLNTEKEIDVSADD